MFNKLLNKRVVITLKTGIGVEGILAQWTDEQVIIAYPDNDNYTIVFNPLDNIMMISVFANQDKDTVTTVKQNSEPVIEPPEPKLDHFEPNPELRALKLADLHIKKTNAIKEQLTRRFKTYTAGTPRGPSYDTPDFTK